MTLFARYARNTAGRDFIVGDIHGHFARLYAQLISIGFDKSRDRLFSVGDLVDRGPDSAQALSWLAQPWFKAVRGNHEDMAIRWPAGHMDAQNYMANGGAWNVMLPPQESRRFSEVFDTLPLAIELETELGLVGIVHADCPFPTWADFVDVLETPLLSGALKKGVMEVAMWSRERIMGDKPATNVGGLRALVVGHTPVKEITALGNVLHIDTGGWLPEGRQRPFTLLDAATLRPHGQAAPKGSA